MASSIPTVGGSSSSADFVRKLYSMLEDPANRATVRWGNEGDTFVVLDTEAFTRSILPKHFKHSNFSSFVRQLNKYDFHKVKRAEDGSQSPYGSNASEFRHSEFRANRKDNLDSIRRKNPAPKKAPFADDQLSTTNNIGLVNELATTTQQQVQQLQEKIRDMNQSHRHLLSEISQLRKVVSFQRQSQSELLHYLAYARRDRASGVSGGATGGSDGLDDLPPGLRQAKDLLSVVDRELEKNGAAYASHIESPSGMFPQPSSSGLNIANDPMNDIARFPIYPVGQTVGIDPFHSDHINNIPYQLPPNPAAAAAAAYSAPPPPPEPPLVSPPTSNTQGSLSVWGRRKPKVLLAEDDQTCSRIGSKFLTTMDCTVDVAPDGVVAVAKVNRAPEYFDLVFMDIVMPGLDGASATELIRQTAPALPVIAMTSNIKPEDVQWYAEHGMNGVLAKPFTKDGMLRVLKQHLPHLLKEADTPLAAPVGGFAPIPHVGVLSAATGSVPVKFEATPPAQSPSTTSTSWNNSPGGFPQPSPTVGNLDAGFAVGLAGNGQLVSTPTGPGTQRPGFSPDMPPPAGPSGGDERPNKRPKVFRHPDSFVPR